MLLTNKCSAVTSIEVVLKFDNGFVKERVIGKGDLIDVIFNYNGCRKEIEGKIIKVSAEGADPKKWYIIVDSSDGFDATQYKFSPANILDLEVIKKYDATQFVESTNDYTNIKAIRFVKGRLQITQDGRTWLPICIDPENIIKDEEYGIRHKHGPRPDDIPSVDDDVILDEVQ